MASDTFSLRSMRVVLEGGVRPATVVVTSGKITSVEGYDCAIQPSHPLLHTDCIVFPGVVDSHVHINEPGRSHWEGFDTATRAAAHGGITTLVDMPLNSIPSTVDMAALSEKRRFANGSIWVDVGLWGGIVPGCAPHIRPLVEEGGVRGFKCFLCPSGVDEFPMCRDEDLHAGFRELVGLRARSVFLFHAEKEVAEASSAGGGDPRAYRTFLQSRPPSMEEAGIATVISFCRQYNYPCHIVHLSSAECLPMIREAKREGLPLTVETCHHYLTLSADQIPDGKTEYKCCPPIRDDGNRELLWKALLDGTIDMVVSDHSPSVDSLKCRHSGDFMAAWGGISSVQFGLSILLTNAMERGIALDRLAQWVCVNTAKLAGLDHRKGRIAVGYDADFALIDDSKTFSITQSVVQHKNKTSPYVGKTLRGLVKSTFLRGTLVYDAELDMMVPAAPTGKILDDVFLKAAKI